ncbi:YheT family hydrolase [Candidatus Leptofilum sp.]|uniref:YheT family hydrolase n=1 Tax=Candidatus Leptofilum sp. TaxID=3241576 RepID=UPI003B5C7F7A
MTDFQLNPYKPTKWLPGGHWQTVFGRLVRRKDGIIFHRRRLDTPDGDFIDIDFPEVAGHLLPDNAPLVLLLHGLEGNARRGYACETYRRLAQLGVRSVGLNYRSCSGEMNRKARFYHSGATDDVAFVLETLANWFPNSKRGLIGFSLGANLTLKFLGELGGKANDWVETPARFGSLAEQLSGVEAAVAVSPPFDMKSSSALLEQGFSRFYTRYFLHSLHEKVRAKADLLAPVVDLDKVLAARTFREFDHYGTAPLGGFDGADDYYEKCSTAQFLPHIRVPTLLLRALDDPLFAPDDVPYDIIAANPCLTTGITAQGGHLGFVEGQPGSFNCWAEQEAARFLAVHLTKSPAGSTLEPDSLRKPAGG